MSIVQNFDLYAPKLVEKREFFCSGHRACQGCGEVLALRHICKALGDDVVVSNATGCMEIISTFYPHTAWEVPWIHVAFENAAAVGSGVEAALKVLRRKGKIADRYVKTVAVAGDGGTVDIGLQSLSGAMERGHQMLYVCYDNQGYMNTGVQRSGATPPAARTANTGTAGPEPGNSFGQGKSAPLIAMAHEIPYVATATVADLRDLERKVEKAMSMHGARYLHVLVPCPLGWAAGPSDTIKLARLAKESGIFPVFEAEYGEVTAVTPIRRQVQVEEYLRLQGRYAHLFGKQPRPDLVARIQAGADRNIARFGLLEAEPGPGSD